MVLGLYKFAYERLARSVIFRRSAQRAHEGAMRLLSLCDRVGPVCAVLSLVRRVVLKSEPVEVGGVLLPSSLMLAAGFVKGHGFADEDAAMRTVRSGRNVIPGWRAMPALVGPVEFGSFTRFPRPGNEGTVMWRDASTRSLQNRVGLRNPGAEAGAAFLARQRKHLPKCFGINIAVSPGVSDPDTVKLEVLEAIDAFGKRGVYPSWYTLNLSCPNTEDDPGGRQTESASRDLCQHVVQRLSQGERPIPLWVKLSPDLAPEQYRILVRVLSEAGAKAIVATNTVPMPTPDNPQLVAGVGGGLLYESALSSVRVLVEEVLRGGYHIDIIGCGGVLDGDTYHAYLEAGARAVQYWSALVYRGPLAGAVIAQEERAYGRARDRRGAAGDRGRRVRAARARHV